MYDMHDGCRGHGSIHRISYIETVYIGAGLHFVQEDQPYAIGRAISDWYRRLK